MVRHQPATLLETSLEGVAQMVAQCAVRAARWGQYPGELGELVTHWCSACFV